MGPYLIFDKSFLESLTVDESVWLDNFFLSNIISTFYVETLADLGKEGKKGKINRTPEELVEEIVNKTPVIESCPNVYYLRLVVGEMMGQSVEMTIHHRPIVQGGEYMMSPDGKVRINFKQFPESAALERWKRHEFHEVEREVARDWREILTDIKADALISLVTKEYPDSQKLSSIEEVKEFAEKAVKARHNQFIYLAFDLLNIPEKARTTIKKRWQQTRPLPFNEFAPYSAFVLKINLFFYLCLSKSFLAMSHKGKQTNIIDLSYLYYLPFCMVFASNDSLHKRIAPLFMGDEQTFVHGLELKEDLKRINEYYSQLPDEVKLLGVMKMASYPPENIETLVGKLHDKHLKPWRSKAKDAKAKLLKPEKRDKALLEHLKKEQAEQIPYIGPPISSDDAHSMTLTKRVPVKRGSWRILPEGIENKK